jgi:protein gp37
MGDITSISWTDHTFNPWWGCTKIEGPGESGSACDHCYAASTAKRYGHDIWGKDADRRFLSDANWKKPLRWERQAIEDGHPHLVFCASMWIIIGGESGSGWRPLNLTTVRQIRDDCAEAGVPFFFKQDSGQRPGTPGPPDLAIQQFPAQALR